MRILYLTCCLLLVSNNYAYAGYIKPNAVEDNIAYIDVMHHVDVNIDPAYTEYWNNEPLKRKFRIQMAQNVYTRVPIELGLRNLNKRFLNDNAFITALIYNSKMKNKRLYSRYNFFNTDSTISVLIDLAMDLGINLGFQIDEEMEIMEQQGEELKDDIIPKHDDSSITDIIIDDDIVLITKNN